MYLLFNIALTLVLFQERIYLPNTELILILILIPSSGLPSIVPISSKELS